MFTIEKQRTIDHKNGPTVWQTINHEANLEQTIRIVQDGIRKEDAIFKIWDNYSGKRYTLAELYEIQRIARNGT